ncbi:MAG: hypothetical protein H6Q15_522 [Bacteroidetes bacterium]|nr:hypothetical protein [Bacteroidota bacterium]
MDDFGVKNVSNLGFGKINFVFLYFYLISMNLSLIKIYRNEVYFQRYSDSKQIELDSIKME